MNDDKAEIPSQETTSQEKPLAHLDNLLNELRAQADDAARKQKQDPKPPSAFSRQRPVSINEKIREEKARKEKIANDIREKDHRLKERTLTLLFIFLGMETLVIFYISLLQGFKLEGFELDAWSFRLLVTATLGQITAMLTIAIKHLFPRK